MGTSSKADKQRSTITRRIHFIYWCTIRGIIDEIFPLIKLSPIGVIYMLAMYAVFLATGHAISCRSIKSSSVTKYIADIANYLRQFAKDTTRDVRKVGTTIAHQINSITAEMKRLEDIPNWREPWSLYLQTQLSNHCKKEPPDSFARSVKNFYRNSCYSGNRRIEVFQEGTNRQGKVQMNNRGDPCAFCIGDIEFLSSNSRTVVPHHIVVRNRSRIHYTQKCYCIQKNNKNSQKKKLGWNKTHPHLGPVKDWLDIVDRFLRLVGPTVTDRPLAIYKCEKTKKILNICTDDSKKLMRFIVQKTYDITNKKELSNFTNHLIRVGACCILQSRKASDSFIQNALRWKSDTWKMYCRNLTSVANDLSETISCEYEAALLANLQIN